MIRCTDCGTALMLLLLSWGQIGVHYDLTSRHILAKPILLFVPILNQNPPLLAPAAITVHIFAPNND
jgi:hypothetical protein